MQTHPLLKLAVDAAGGLERWKHVREVHATMSSGGLAFNARLRGAKRHLTAPAGASTRRPRMESPNASSRLSGSTPTSPACGNHSNCPRLSHWAFI